MVVLYLIPVFIISLVLIGLVVSYILHEKAEYDKLKFDFMQEFTDSPPANQNTEPAPQSQTVFLENEDDSSDDTEITDSDDAEFVCEDEDLPWN